jgi:hypothetical protein
VLLVGVQLLSSPFHDLFELKRLYGKLISQTLKQIALTWICRRRAQASKMLRISAELMQLSAEVFHRSCPSARRSVLASDGSAAERSLTETENNRAARSTSATFFRRASNWAISCSSLSMTTITTRKSFLDKSPDRNSHAHHNREKVALTLSGQPST